MLWSLNNVAFYQKYGVSLLKKLNTKYFWPTAYISTTNTVSNQKNNLMYNKMAKK